MDTNTNTNTNMVKTEQPVEQNAKRVILTEEERKEHRREASRKWYLAHKAAKKTDGQPTAKKPRKIARHAANPAAGQPVPAQKKRGRPVKAVKAAKPTPEEKQLSKLLKKLEKAKANLQTAKDTVTVIKAEIAATKAAVKAAK